MQAQAQSWPYAYLDGACHVQNAQRCPLAVYAEQLTKTLRLCSQVFPCQVTPLMTSAGAARPGASAQCTSGSCCQAAASGAPTTLPPLLGGRHTRPLSIPCLLPTPVPGHAACRAFAWTPPAAAGAGQLVPAHCSVPQRTGQMLPPLPGTHLPASARICPARPVAMYMLPVQSSCKLGPASPEQELLLR